MSAGDLILDCGSFDTALATTSRILEADPEAVTDWLSSLDLERIAGEPEGLGGYAEDYLFSHAPFGRTHDATADGVHWFHASRVPDPTVFLRDGLLPLEPGAERIWEFLRGVAGERVTDEEWVRIRGEGAGHQDITYRMSLSDCTEQGPCAWIVREKAIAPASGFSDPASRGADALQNLCETIKRRGGLDLYEEARRASTPCVIKFFHADWRPEFLGAVLHYLYGAVHAQDVLRGPTAGNFDGRGQAIPPEDICEVERLES